MTILRLIMKTNNELEALAISISDSLVGSQYTLDYYLFRQGLTLDERLKIKLMILEHFEYVNGIWRQK